MGKIATAVTPLVHKSDPHVKMNSLEVLCSLVARYQSNLGSSGQAITEAALYCLSPDNPQVSEQALNVLNLLALHGMSKQQADTAIEKSI